MNNTKRNTLKLMGAGAVASTLPTTASATPKRGGTIRVALSGGSNTDDFDPTKTLGYMQGCYHLLVYNKLIEQESDTGKLKPELATSWESSNKNKEWVFNIRKGIKFHDGTPLSADDVLYSIKLHTHESSKSSGKAYFTGLIEIKKTSKYQIKITFDNPNPDLPSALSLYNFLIVKNGHTDWNNPIGTGGYVIDSFNPGVKGRFKRTNDYWRKDYAWADFVEVIYFQDSASQVNALLAGSIDVITKIPTNIVKRLEASSKVNVVKASTKAHFTWPMRQTQGVYKDNNVRLALKYGLERDKIVDIALNGYGAVGNDNPISESYENYADIAKISYDADKSRHYLKKAGMSNLKVDLSVSNAAIGGGVEESALVYQESAKKAGIDINIVREPADGYWSNVWMKKPFTSSFFNGRPTATLMFDLAYTSASKWNESEFKNKKFDNLVREAKATSSMAERKEKLAECQRMITFEGAVIIPAFRMLLEASSSRIGGLKPSITQEVNNMSIETLWVK